VGSRARSLVTILTELPRLATVPDQNYSPRCVYIYEKGEACITHCGKQILNSGWKSARKEKITWKT